MERYEKLEMQVIAFEVDDVLINATNGVAGGSGQGLQVETGTTTTNNNNPGTAVGPAGPDVP